MLSLNLPDILDLDTNIRLQENLHHTNRLKLDITTSMVQTDEMIEQALYSARLILMGELLAHNNELNHLELQFYPDDAPLPESFILNVFQALGSIPNPVKKLRLQIAEYALITLVENALAQKALFNIIKTKPAFQNIEELELLDNPLFSDTSAIGWSAFFQRLFCAVPNKSELRSLSLHCDSCDFVTDIRLQKAIEECKQLTQLSIKGHRIRSPLWSFIGNFIQSHQALKIIALDAKYCVHDFAFLGAALGNRQLNTISLAFTLYDYSRHTINHRMGINRARYILDSIGQRIGAMANLSRLKLEIMLDSLFKPLAPTLFIPILSNPTLSDLSFDIDNLYLDEDMKNLLLTNKKLRSITKKNLDADEVRSHEQKTKDIICSGKELSSSDTYQLDFSEKIVKEYKRREEEIDFLNRLAQRNIDLCNSYQPFFRTAALESKSINLSSTELISMNSIWLTLMASYRLNAPTNKILQDFNRDYFMLICNQFFNQIHPHCLQKLPEDVCHIIAEYTDRPTFAKLNSVTGGYFFRQVKPLIKRNEVLSLVSSNAEDENSHSYSNPK